MYKKILVPLDGSKRAEAILPHVEEMAHRFEAEVILLQVVEPPSIVATQNVELLELWKFILVVQDLKFKKINY